MSVPLCIAVVGDPGSHGGTLTVPGQDGRATLAGIPICVLGAVYDCPIHGPNSVTVTPALKSTVNSIPMVVTGATTECGAQITPPDRKAYASS